MTRTFFGSLIFLTAAASSSAQAVDSVYVSSTADDDVGKQLVYEVREAVRRSAGMKLVNTLDASRHQLRIVTISNAEPNESQRFTMYSMVLTLRTWHKDPVVMYKGQHVGFCGRSRLAECARSLIAVLDEQVTEVKGWASN